MRRMYLIRLGELQMDTESTIRDARRYLIVLCINFIVGRMFEIKTPSECLPADYSG